MIRAMVGGTVGVFVALVGLAGGAATSVAGTPGAYVRPVAGAALTQGFGCTAFAFEAVDINCPGGHWHSGIDLAAPAGTPVHATAGGRASVIRSIGGYGIHVVIDHGDGITSLYGHLQSSASINGADVASGDVIGWVGSTGNSTGPHLHFEIQRNGVPEDPRDDVALP